VAPRGPLNDPLDGKQSWSRVQLQYTSLDWYHLQLLEETKDDWEASDAVADAKVPEEVGMGMELDGFDAPREIVLEKQEAETMEWLKNAAAEGDEDAQYHIACIGVPPEFDEADSCYECGRHFNATRYRHHCRACGHSICSQHSADKHRLPHLGFRVPVRVCTRCKPALRRRDALQRVMWRYERVCAFLRGKLIPYFELEVDPHEEKAKRAMTGVITAAKYSPLSVSASFVVETVDLLRKYGYTGLAGLVMHKEFTEAAELLKQVAGVEKKWPMKVHEMTAALYYLVGASRGERGSDPEYERHLHTQQLGDSRQKPIRLDLDSDGDVDLDLDFGLGVDIDEPDFGDCVSAEEDLAGSRGGKEQAEREGSRMVFGEATGEDLEEIMSYAPFALHYLYGSRSAVDTQLLARHQGWSLVFLSSGDELHCPAFALFAHRGERKCVLAIRGTATITDVVTDIRARPVRFPPDFKDLDLPGWRPNANPKEFPSAWQELAKVTDGPTESMACLGMATAAEWVAAEVCTPLTHLHRQGYKVILTGHSLGAAVATLLGALLRGDEIITDLKVIGFSTPACTSRFLAERCREFSTHVILHDDVVPRITPRGLRGLVNDIVAADKGNEWQPQLKEDLHALTERVRSIWAPRKRSGRKLNALVAAEQAEETLIKAIEDTVKTPDEKEVGGSLAKRQDEGAESDNPEETSEVKNAEAKDAEMKDSRENGSEDAMEEDGDEKGFKDAPTATDAATEGDGVDSRELGKASESAMETALAKAEGDNSSLGRTQSDEGVIVARPVMPEVYVPGDVLHIYSWRGVYRAAWVPFDFVDLSYIKPLPNMLKDHAADNVWEALREVCAVRHAQEVPPAWVPFENARVCSCCEAVFTWASTLRSKAQEARDKHNCRACGRLVCAPCSSNRVSLPKFGLLEPSRVCDRCFYTLYEV